MTTNTTKIAGEDMTAALPQSFIDALDQYGGAESNNATNIGRGGPGLHEHVEKRYTAVLDAARALLASKPAVPEGWKLVPVDPTPEMLDMGVDANATSWDGDTDQGFPREVANDIYRAMLAAVPTAPAQSCGDAACSTCSGHGMIGGPSYYSPDEGGEPCPDCNAPQIGEDAANGARGEREAFEAWCKENAVDGLTDYKTYMKCERAWIDSQIYTRAALTAEKVAAVPDK